MKRLLLLMALALPAFAGYSYDRTFTIVGAHVATVNNTTASTYTAYVCFNGASPCNTVVNGLNQSGAGAHVTNSSGYDIAFSTTACASPTLMGWETISYTASNGSYFGTLYTGTLTYNTNLVVHICYGNSAISTFQGGATGAAWNAKFAAVWHMAGASGADSTANGHTLTATSVVTTPGTIFPYPSGVAAFNGSTSTFHNASDTGMPTGPISNCAWINMASGNGVFLWYGTNNPGWSLLSIVNSPPGLDIAFAGPGSYGPTFSYSTWIFGCAVLNSAGTSVQFYLNGAASSSASVSGSISLGGSLNVGYSPTIGYYLNGALQDEFITNTAMSADDIATIYNNMSAPNTFESFGSETPVTASHGAAILVAQ